MAEEIRAKINILEAHASLGYAGGQRNLASFAKYLDKTVFNVYALGYLEGGVQEKRLAELGIEALNGGGQIEKILSFISDKKIDVLHLHRSGDYQPLETAIIEGAKKINPRMIILEKNVFGKFDQVSGGLIDCHFFQSMMHLNERYLPASGEGFDFARHKVMYNMIDAEEFEAYRLSPQEIMAAKRELGIGSDEFVIAKIGRPDPAKWSDLIIEMLPTLIKLRPKLKFILVGVPDSRRKILSRKPFAGRLIILEPITDERELHRLYQVSDVLAHSSKIGECNGNTINEAMFWGKPVVTNSTPARDNGQLEQVINSVNGYIADYPETFARALAELAADDAKRRRFGEAGKRQVLKVNDPKAITRALSSIITGEDLSCLQAMPSQEQILAYKQEYLRRLSNQYGSLSAWESWRRYWRIAPRFFWKVRDYLEVNG